MTGLTPSIPMSRLAKSTVAARAAGANSTTKRNRRQKRANRNHKSQPIDPHGAWGTDHTESILTPCAVLYASASCDPWDTPAGACVPDGDMRDTFRMKVFARGSLVANTSGSAWIALNPNGLVQSTNPCVTYSALTTAPDTSTRDTTTTGVGSANSNSLFSSGAFSDSGNGNMYRPVCFGIRIRDVSPELDISGYAVGLVMPGDGVSPTMEATTMVQFLSNPDVEQLTLDSKREWIRVCANVASCGGVESEYIATFGNLSPTSTSIGDILCQIQIGGAQSGNAYEWEVVGHYEVDGNLPSKQPSHADPIGSASVDAQMAKADYRAARSGQLTAPSEPKRFLGRVLDYVVDGVSGVARILAPVAKEAGKAGAFALLAALL